MLASYFQYRSELAKKDCSFQCPQTCDAPGCRSPDVIVDVTTFDLIELGRVLDDSVSSLFARHCRLGLQNIEYRPRYKRLLLKLIKPCHFYRETNCAVHHSKPLNCVLFPEYHQITNAASTCKEHPAFYEFQCLNENITISSARRRALIQLRRIKRIEEAVSCYFLFGSASFIIDSKPFNKELKRLFSKPEAISLQAYDDLMVKKLKRIGFFNRFMQNLAILDSDRGIARIFNILTQNDLTSLLSDQLIKPNVIHTFKGKGFRQRKRKLAPRSLTYLLF